MVLISLIWFHHMDTILMVLLLFVNLTLYLKLNEDFSPYVLCIYM